jgi:hypothetical protein
MASPRAPSVCCVVLRDPCSVIVRKIPVNLRGGNNVVSSIVCLGFMRNSDMSSDERKRERVILNNEWHKLAYDAGHGVRRARQRDAARPAPTVVATRASKGCKSDDAGL